MIFELGCHGNITIILLILVLPWLYLICKILYLHCCDNIAEGHKTSKENFMTHLQQFIIFFPHKLFSSNILPKITAISS